MNFLVARPLPYIEKMIIDKELYKDYDEPIPETLPDWLMLIKQNNHLLTIKQYRSFKSQFPDMKISSGMTCGSISRNPYLSGSYVVVNCII